MLVAFVCAYYFLLHPVLTVFTEGVDPQCLDRIEAALVARTGVKPHRTGPNRLTVPIGTDIINLVLYYMAAREVDLELADHGLVVRARPTLFAQRPNHIRWPELRELIAQSLRGDSSGGSAAGPP
jgi:hypothetical protein